MARIRTIKPEFWEDEKLSKASIQARMLFIGMWNFSDDQGVVRSTPKFLLSKIFPYDDISISEIQTWCRQLVEARAILPIQHEGESYYIIRTFKNHQKTDPRYAKFIVPVEVVDSQLKNSSQEIPPSAQRAHSEATEIPAERTEKLPADIGMGSGSGSGGEVEGESIAVNGSHAPRNFVFPDDLDEIKPHPTNPPEPQKKETARRQKNDPVSLEDSRWGDRKVFDAECPKEWDQAKKDHYWLAMQNYSNRGNKLKDWVQAASNWERRDSLDALNKKHPLPQVNGNQPYFEQPQHTDQINKLLYAFNEFAKTNHDHKDPSVRKPISLRLAAGADPQDMLEIIQLKCLEWGTDKRQFLTLNALFSDKNYANFLQEVQDIKDKKRAPNLSTQQLGKIRHERIKAALGQDF